MQFTEALWEDIRKLKLAGVTWELIPKETPKIPLDIPKVIVPPVVIPEPPVIEPPIVPEVLLHEATIPSHEVIEVKPKRVKNENPTVPKKRSTNKRGKRSTKK